MAEVNVQQQPDRDFEHKSVDYLRHYNSYRGIRELLNIQNSVSPKMMIMRKKKRIFFVIRFRSVIEYC